MSLIDYSEEKKQIYKWAESSMHDSDDYSFEVKKKSYYSTFDNSNNIEEYDFNNLSDINTMLKQMWKNDINKETIIKPCSVAILKGKIRSMKSDTKAEAETSIPDYIYVF